MKMGIQWKLSNIYGQYYHLYESTIRRIGKRFLRSGSMGDQRA